MNISQPIPSAIESVDFAFLSREEIRSLSVKQIQNPTTFDTLLHPVPGGLYDPALGAWGENACATCNLNSSACPGHCGHIELPIPVYHVTFVDQITRLLRGQCAHCWQFKMSRKDIDMYICKLRLIQYGLLDALDLLESLEDDKKPSKEDQDDASDEDESNQPISLLLKKRRDLVEKSIQASRNSRWHWSREKNEGVAEARRSVIKDFMASMAKGKTCRNCQAISRKIRKDKYVKLFETPLEGKDKAKMEQGVFTFKNAVVVLSNDKKPDHEDEGIADIDLSDSSEGEGEQLDVNGDVVMENEPSTSRTKSKSKKPSAGEIYIPPKEAHARLTLLFETEQDLLSLVYNSRAAQDKPVKITADMFFIETLLVPPNKFRPEAKTGAGEIAEAQQNSLYKVILNNSDRFAQIVRIVQGLEEDKSEVPRQRTIVDLHEAGVKIQESVNALIDKDRNPIQGGAGKNNEDGIKQKLEKKEGLFRKNMMGKRVNFAARSVISPDPNIETNEIGVPPVFAKKLTYPEPVTSHNYREMRQAVMNGPDKWPGAAAIENENGMVINLAKKTYDERVALSNQLLAPSNSTSNGSRNKKVHRHLTNGDVVLMNRQPTLHKPSIMGHRARVLPGEKTIRMHYANCNTYNADFDGDEMNMHFPQSEVARAEALQIADTDHQYLVATSGKPLRGLIQDHLSGGVWMTNRDTFFDREKYQQLLYNCLRPESGHTNSDRIETVPPAILKPRAMWTGKQVITTILTNITPPDCAPLSFTSNSTSKDQWGQGSEEGLVLFSKGQMISGILDKAQLGPTSGGLVHSVHEVYGPTVAGKLLSILGRLLTKFLHMRAFTCGMDDLVLTPKGDEERKRQLQESHNIGLEVAKKYVTLEDQTPTDTDPELLRRLEDVLRDDSKQDGLDRLMNTKTANLSAAITKACLPRGLVKRFPKNQMQLMTTSGAKGSAVNANLISCNLGQQVLEGRRVPVMVSGKSLPCFKPFDTDIRAGGYVINRFLTGIRPQEYYFHAMAGREGLIDTAVKTSRSGYLQRCLIKGMEGLKVEYDTSVRDADGSLVQFISGEDGLDVTKQKHLTDFSFLIRNFDSEVAQLNMGKHLDVIQDESEQVKGIMKAAIKATKKGDFSSVDTVMTHYQPGRHLYATSESFHNLVADYLKKNPDGLVKSRKSKGGSSSYEDPDARPKALLEVILNTKYLRSVVEPGEVVGIVAGQSVGEPSTQMTLNTFHLAGHSTRNVTLGIPRLREIVMTASAKISTPSMTLFLIEELSAEEGEKVSRAISKLSLAEIVDEATVDERMDVGVTRSRAKIYEFTLKFFSMKEYSAIYAITKEDVIATLVQKFVPKLQSAARKALGKKKSERSGKVVSDALPVIGESAGAIEQADDRANAEDGDDDEGEEEEDDDEGEDDATGAKQKANRGQAISYAANDEDDDVVQAHAQDMEEGDEYENDDERPGGGQPSSSDEFGTGKKAKKYNAGAAADREGVVKDKNQDVGYFQFDDKDGAWCKLSLEYNPDVPKVLMLSILEKSLHNSLIQQIPGLGKCSFVPNDKVKDFATGKDVTAAVIHTDGVNLKAMQNYPQYINPNKTSTNDIAAMLRYYGVEACRANIIQELTAVFVGHGITVDNRHLNLIADYMTRSGGFKPFNRTGLTGSTSPFMKMSFETTLGFLRDAVLDGDWDNLTSPSSRIVLGRTSKAGTGAFDVFTKVPTAAVAAQ